MKIVSLRPTRHSAPKCDDWDDEAEIRRFEIAMRVHRAHIEAYRITPLEGTADFAYRVRGESERWYEVDIVDATGQYDTCSCPDFWGAELGTCKHVEAVRRAMAGSRALGTSARRLKRSPRLPTLSVDARGRPRLVAVGAWVARHFDALGLSQRHGGMIEPSTEVTLQPGERSGIRVTHAAALVAARLAERQTLERRRAALTRGFRAGVLHTDVLKLALFPYQKEGVIHLASAGRALLADDMGLGKTVQAIAACELLRARGEVSRVLVVTTASLKEQWAREIERYSGERAVVVSGNPELRRTALGSDAPYKVLNYELTWRELGLLRALDADVVIYDEAQRAKNFRTKTAITLRSIPSRFVFVLSGTPVENKLDDLYALLQLLDPQLLGPLWRFNLEHHSRNSKGKILGYKELGKLRQRIAPVVLRRRKQEVLTQLPALTEQTRYTPLSEDQARLEAGYRADAARLASIAERRPLSPEEHKQIMMLLLKARQACNALELCDPGRRASPKLDEFEALVSEIAAQGSSKILVFSEWVEMLKLAAERLDGLGLGYVQLHGGIAPDKRPALLDRFRESPDLRVLLSTDAGGVGLNLQVASYVVHLDLPWNPGKLDQRTARAHRLGQTRGVSVTYLCAESGIERGIEGTLAVKRDLRAAALDPGSELDTLDAPSFGVFLKQLQGVLERFELQEPSSPSADAMIGETAPIDVGPGAETEGDLSTQAAAQRGAPAELGAATEFDPAATSATPASELALQPASATPERSGQPQRLGERLGDQSGEETVAHAAPEPRGDLPAASAGREPEHARWSESSAGNARAADRLRLARVVLDAGFAGDAVRAAYDALAAAIRGLTDLSSDSSHASLVAVIYQDLLPRGLLAPAAHGVLARLHDLSMLDAQGITVDLTIAAQSVAEVEHWVARMNSEPTPSPPDLTYAN